MGSSGLIKNQRVDKRKAEISRELRRSMTKAEAIFWEHVRGRKYHGLKFRRQQVIDGFIVDFYCDELRLCIEIDGSVHESKEVKRYDKERDEVLKLRGLRLVRFTNREVMSDIDGVLERVC